MGKKNKASGNLGRSLIKDRFGSSNKNRRAKDSSLLHTAEVDDGYDWGRLNLQSVTEESSFQEFLSTAELAGTEFQAEKLNITFVNPKSGVGLLSKEERNDVLESQNKNKQLLGIPRRPKWDENTTVEELQINERDEFLNWRRRLALLQEVEGVLLTPYEKNLEFWRQLWRVVEKSDVVVQIVDARNPLLFRCEDLEHYVLEVSPNKQNLILLNKADFLTSVQRQVWAEYFGLLGVQVAFFSATLSTEQQSTGNQVQEVELTDSSKELQRDCERCLVECHCDQESVQQHNAEVAEKIDVISNDLEKNIREILQLNDTKIEDGQDVRVINSNELLSRSQLIALFHSLHTGIKVTSGITTIGLVGYPNVGKSSTINALLMEKKVSVSATPGKTKHFQTLFLDKDLLLCDCPGLVMPSFVFTKAEMVVNGILPIDQMRDHVPPVTLVASLIPRHVLENKYGLMLPLPDEGEDPHRPPTAEELLNAYGYNRGFMTQNGQPDNPRSARYVLKDFVSGNLLYCYAPPGYPQDQYYIFPVKSNVVENRMLPPRSRKMLKSNKITAEDLDKVFFKSASHGIHRKCASGQTHDAQSSSSDNVSGSSASLQHKPWKDHHNKRNKREKLRRVYAYLDE